MVCNPYNKGLTFLIHKEYLQTDEKQIDPRGDWGLLLTSQFPGLPQEAAVPGGSWKFSGHRLSS